MEFTLMAPSRMLQSLDSKDSSKTFSSSVTKLAAIWWVVWTEHNGICFRDVPLDVSRALERVAVLIEAWNEAL
ncbi:hypothetical protein ACMD2_12308 [Ananas comosus]|uniref:Uncharacterized protein n=1 Tax=Ananas comosus TaxID=4615 RepID=A0A199W8H4_ANACO|nr:hypothetical protein ACMD2_12308 [Ananas comosus]